MSVFISAIASREFRQSCWYDFRSLFSRKTFTASRKGPYRPDAYFAEYAMNKAASQKGWINGDQVAIEQLTAIKRAGANFILTYHAREIAEIL